MSLPKPSPVVFPANPSRIVLTGFMGAGKTTVGALLAERLGWNFVDSDREVEARAGATIAEIFERRGEAAFREMEAEAIRKIAASDRVVMAIGGGSLETAATRDFLGGDVPDCVIVFLEAPLETMLARCAGHADGPVRPVLADRDRLAERWRQRLPWYRAAHLTVQTAELSPQAVTDRIAERLQLSTRMKMQNECEAVSSSSRGKSGVSA
jgi:shikimate kinase